MKSLKTKMLWMLIVGLSLLQFSFALLMSSQGHENTCAFSEHCILESAVNQSEAVLPLLLTLVVPVFFVFLSYSENKSSLSPVPLRPDRNLLRRTLKGVIQRE
jgi:Mn2+/Fe2+ NRAMP family transporter